MSVENPLWSFIGRMAGIGLVLYLALVLAAGLRDWARSHIAHKRKPPFFKLGGMRLSLVVLQERFQSGYRDTHFFYYIELVRFSANIVVCVTYVTGTYHQNVTHAIQAIQRALSILFTIDLCGRLWLSDSSLSSVFSLLSFFESLSLPSLFAASGPLAYLHFGFLRAFSAYCGYSRLERRMFILLFSPKRLALRLAFQFLTLIFTLAAGMQLLEIPGDLLSDTFLSNWSAFENWNFFNSLYFVVVTLSTVGYGDISPATIQGRIFGIGMIVVGIVIFSAVVARVVEETTRGRGTGSFVKRPDTAHIIVAGTPTLSDLVHFVSEFYADSRHGSVNTKIVVLIEEPKWSDVEWFRHIARNQFLQNRLLFLVGSVRNVSDLDRAQVRSADAFFFLTSPSTGEEPSMQDTRTVMNALAVRNVRSDIPVYAQMLLKDSNVQICVALRTRAGRADDLLFRDRMPRRATYQGLFRELFTREFQIMPPAFQKGSRSSFEKVLRNYEKIHSDMAAKAPLKDQEDLDRSDWICLQEMHMALMAGNIKTNGVGTLTTNMYLDLNPPFNELDPPWLSEYQMGARCTLAHAIIPAELDNVSLDAIAGDLFLYGLLLIATQCPTARTPSTVLNTQRLLRCGDLGLFLTYHHYRYICAALRLVALRYGRGIGTLKGSASNDTSSGKGTNGDGDDSHSKDRPRRERPSAVAPALDAVSPQKANAYVKRDLKTMQNEQEDGESSELLTPFQRVVTSTSRDSHDSFLGTSIFDPALDLSLVGRRSDGYMPDSISRHIIVAMEGTTPLANLSLFLKHVWFKDKRNSFRRAVKTPVIVVHPSLTAKYRESFAQHDGRSLFFVEGSPASRETWQRARLHTAQAIVTMADYTAPWHITDARTIFTFLTLDVSTLTHQDVFVCSELVDEKSLEFLREPIHARRLGAALGDSADNTEIEDEPILPVGISALDEKAVDCHVAEENAKLRKLAMNFTEDTSENRAAAGPPAESHVSPVSPTEGSSNDTNYDIPEGQLDAAGMQSTKSERAKKAGLRNMLSGGRHGARSPQPPDASSGSSDEHRRIGSRVDGIERILFGGADAEGGETAITEERRTPGAARARRGTLFSRSRYAAGELLIHSSAITLLVREYVEPGFVQFYMDLIGADSRSPSLKIRLVRIPTAMFDTSNITRPEGRCVLYQDVFARLIKLGATPLGLYRSGDAPARLPVKLRKKRAADIMRELQSYAEEGEFLSQPTDFMEPQTLGGLLRAVWKQVHDLMPSVRQDNLDREVLCGYSSTSSSSSSDDVDAGESSGKVQGTVQGADRNSTGDKALSHTPAVVAFNATGGSEGQREISESPTVDPGLEDKVRPAGSHVRAISYWDGMLAPEKSRSKIGLLSRFRSGKDGPQGDSEDEHTIVPNIPFYERPVVGNLLPYVYTLPDPFTLCAETDGVYVLCDPSLDLPVAWPETDNAAMESSHGGKDWL